MRISDIVRYKDDFIPTERFETDEHTRALWRLDSSSGFRDSSGNDNLLLYKGEPFSVHYWGKLGAITWGRIKKR